MQPVTFQFDRLPSLKDHQDLPIVNTSQATTTVLDPGYYCFEPETANCYLLLRTNALDSADGTCLWIRAGDKRYQVISALNVSVAVIRAGLTDGTLHINRVG